jgi:hypothetical protein
MATRKVWVTLEATGVHVVTVAGILRDFTAVDRMKRAALVMGGAVVLAGALIPIPIIHLLGIPLVLLAGIVMAGRQLTLAARLQPLRIACPKCGAVNRVGGGLGYRSVASGLDRTCDSCRRSLTMRITDQ